MGTYSTASRLPSTLSKNSSQVAALNLKISVLSPLAQPTWAQACAPPSTFNSQNLPKTVPTLKLRKSANHSASVYAVSVVNTLQLVPMVPLIFHQKLDSAFLKLKLLALCTKVLKKFGVLNKTLRLLCETTTRLIFNTLKKM